LNTQNSDHTLIRIFFVGDVIGAPGRKILKKNIATLKKNLNIDFVIANIENLADGFGITDKTLKELEDTGAFDGFTSGNHIWDKKEAEKFIDNYPNIIRPLNYPPAAPGHTTLYLEKSGSKILFINLLGRALMKDCVDCPFTTVDKFLKNIDSESKIVIVDFHAEATSEKQALGFFLDGKVAAVIGTHTHVQTADEKILPLGTAYISDAGMTGNIDSVIGFHEKNVIDKFLTQMPRKFEIKDNGTREIQGVLLTIDHSTSKTLTIERIKFRENNYIDPQ